MARGDTVLQGQLFTKDWEHNLKIDHSHLPAEAASVERGWRRAPSPSPPSHLPARSRAGQGGTSQQEGGMRSGLVTGLGKAPWASARNRSQPATTVQFLIRAGTARGGRSWTWAWRPTLLTPSGGSRILGGDFSLCPGLCKGGLTCRGFLCTNLGLAPMALLGR